MIHVNVNNESKALLPAFQINEGSVQGGKDSNFSSINDKDSIFSLPFEIVAHAIQFADRATKLSFAATCRSAFLIVSDQLKSEKAFNYVIYKKIKKSSYYRNAIFTNTTHFKLTQINCVSNTFKQCTEVFENFTNVKQMDIFCWQLTATQLVELFKMSNFQNVTSLRYLWPKDSLMEENTKDCPKIESLEIQGKGEYQPLSGKGLEKFPNLHNIKFVRCKFLSKDIENLQKIQTLTFYLCQITLRHLQTILEECTHLKNLEVDDGVIYTRDNGLNYTQEYSSGTSLSSTPLASNLEIFSLKDVLFTNMVEHRVDYEKLGFLLTLASSSLKKLHLQKMPITRPSLEIIANCPNLAKLSISEQKDLSNEDLIAFIGYVPEGKKLEYIEIIDCRQISSDNTTRLSAICQNVLIEQKPTEETPTT